jgi:hypothetical protein
MGLISGMFMGVVVGVAIMAGWSRVMQQRSRKRVAKVRYLLLFSCYYGVLHLERNCSPLFCRGFSFFL